MISQHQLEESAELECQDNIRIPRQSINFDDVPSIQFLNSFRNQPPVFGARMVRIASSLPVMFPVYSHSRTSYALAGHVRLLGKRKYDLADLTH